MSCDEPGRASKRFFSKGPTTVVSISRMDSEAMADRRRMFELFAAIKVKESEKSRDREQAEREWGKARSPTAASERARLGAESERAREVMVGGVGQERSEPGLAGAVEAAMAHWAGTAAAADAHAAAVAGAARGALDRCAAGLHKLCGAIRHLAPRS
jgi:hypothetical protein